MKTFNIDDCCDSANNGGGGDGATTFIELTDTPNSYTGQAGKVPVVKNNELGLDFEDFPSGGDGSSNVFAIETGEQYTVEKNQELINSGLFHLDGELRLDGKWALLSDTGIATGGFSQLPGNDHSHTELKILANFGMTYETDVYRQVVNHNLNQFPILKFLDPNGVELDPHVRHLGLNNLIIESNTPLEGVIYALHEPHSDTVSEFSDIQLVDVNGVFTQVLNHNQNTFPLFKFLDNQGTELDFKVTHIDMNTTKIESNISVIGKIYML